MVKLFSPLKTLFLLTLITTSALWGESSRGPVTNQQWLKSKYFQMGLSAGTPAGFNFCAGYWFGSEYDNYVTQACGMHFGATLYGLQLDFGKSFYRTKTFKAFWAGSFRTSHADLTGTAVDFAGVGPILGMNWKSLALELGIYLGGGKNTKFFPYLKDPEAGSRAALQFGFQLGVKGLFWQ